LLRSRIETLWIIGPKMHEVGLSFIRRNEVRGSLDIGALYEGPLPLLESAPDPAAKNGGKIRIPLRQRVYGIDGIICPVNAMRRRSAEKFGGRFPRTKVANMDWIDLVQPVSLLRQQGRENLTSNKRDAHPVLIDERSQKREQRVSLVS